LIQTIQYNNCNVVLNLRSNRSRKPSINKQRTTRNPEVISIRRQNIAEKYVIKKVKTMLI